MPTRKKNTSSKKRVAAKVSRSKAGKKKKSKSVFVRRKRVFRRCKRKLHHL